MEKKKTQGFMIKEKSSEVADLIEELTHSGQKTLDIHKFKKVKHFCKKSDKNIAIVYDLIIHQLEKNHSEIRFSAFQLCDEIFRRSHYFRQLVVDKLHHVLELTAETNPDLPSPLPRAAALDLKKLSLRTVRDWCNKYGSGYKKLVLGFNYLQQCKKVDFSALQLQSDAERARDEEKERRLRAINDERVKKVKNELNEFSVDINGTVKSLNSCLNLLLPKPEEFFIPLDDEESNDGVFGLKDFTRNMKTEDEDTRETGTNNRRKSDEEEEEDCDNEEEEFDEDAEPSTVLREFGAFNTKHTVEINLKLDEMNHLKETSENSAIIESVRDHVKLITNNYLPRVKGWMQILIKSSGTEAMIRSAMDLKMSMESSLEKYGRLKIENVMEEDCVSTDSEMEEVNENVGSQNSSRCSKINNLSKSNKNVEDPCMWNILSKEECFEDPTTMQSSLAAFSKQSMKSEERTINEGNSRMKDKQISPCIPSSLTAKAEVHPMPSTSKEIHYSQPSTSKDIDYPQPSTSKDVETDCELNERKRKLLAVAPKLPFDVDLYHWEDDDLKAPTLLPTSMDTNKFWSSGGEDLMEVTIPEGSSRLRTRVIEFVGEFEPVSRFCRAPLPNGKLCPRQDRFKCPFHGKIVSRNEMGQCVNPEDEKDAKEEKKVPDWQDPELLKDIQKATGIDLKIPEKGKKKKKEKKYPGLTDIKAKQNTAKNRLSKLVFKRSAMKRVANALDKIEHRRFRDKYGDQFHYMHDTA